MDWEFLDHDPVLGRSKYIAVDPNNEDTVLVRTEFDRSGVRDIIDDNKALQNEARGPMGEMVLAARIPVAVMYDWLVKFGVNAWNPAHSDGVRKLLNNSDYRYLKCRNIII